MAPRTFALLVLGFVGGFIAGCSPAAPTCSSATCGGCCDAMGKCQSGATVDACGVNAASCGRCGAGTLCQAGECRASGTGGGGGASTGGGTGTGGGASTGGGAGTGGGSSTGGGTGTGGGASTGGGTGTGGGAATGGGSGGGGGCRVVNLFPTTQANLVGAAYRPFTNGVGHYNIAGWETPVAGGLTDGFRVEVVYPGDQFPSLPLNGNFTTANYRTCTVCAAYYENCTTTCQKEYLAQSGAYSITRADRAEAGRMAGSTSNVRLEQWNFGTDSAVPGGGCVIVTAAGPFDIGWNADGGAIP